MKRSFINGDRFSKVFVYGISGQDIKQTKGAMMNLRNLTIGLIGALVYEIVLKTGHLLVPSIFTVSFVSGVASMLFFMVSIIIILFMFSFYNEERSNKKVEMVLKILLGCMVLQFILRRLITQKIIDSQVIPLIGEIIGFFAAALFFVLMIFYKRTIPSHEKFLHQATTFVAIMFGIGIIKSFYALIQSTRFFISGMMVEYPSSFYHLMFIVFLLNHASIIYFLYCYYRRKFAPPSSAN